LVYSSTLGVEIIGAERAPTKPDRDLEPTAGLDSLDWLVGTVYIFSAERPWWLRVKCGGGSPHFFVLDHFLDGM
jgi:hypothetical protein